MGYEGALSPMHEWKPLPPRGTMCRRCVMDESATDLDLDDKGVCRYCRGYDAMKGRRVFDPDVQASQAQALISALKERGRGKDYDCVIGLSGGADSSYALLLAKEHGLRPLVVHVDNGWNSELAVMNIENLVRKLEVDLFTVVIRWEEFRDLQLAFLRAGVVDLEMPSDHAIIAGVMQVARRFHVPTVLSGDNHSTEVTLPPGWNHAKTDLRNLKAIHRAFSRTPLQSFPQLSTLHMQLLMKTKRVQWVPLLTNFPYVKKDAIARLQGALGWRPYPGKHGESIITRFYQGHILPTKFGIDKRRIHLARLICTGQTTRDEAIAELTQPPYDLEVMQLDREFVVKKFGITEGEFDELMQASPRSHFDYPSDRTLLRTLLTLNRWLRHPGEVLRQVRSAHG